jgi:hypothetical protein
VVADYEAAADADIRIATVRKTTPGTRPGLGDIPASLSTGVVGPATAGSLWRIGEGEA